MNRSRTAWLWTRRALASSLLILVGFGCNGPGSEETAEPTGILILSVDTLRYDVLGFAGGTETPVLDGLAAAGTSFSHAMAPMPRTTPALGSLLTGLWPQNHGSREVGDPLVAHVETLAQRLQAAGWTTMAVSVNDSAGPKQGLDRGFERFVSYRDLLTRVGDDLYHEKSPSGPRGTGWATATTDAALRLVDESVADQPWFLWTFYFDPHFVYRPPAPWQDDLEAQGCWELYASYAERTHRGGEIFADIGGVASAALEDCWKLYEAEVRYTDHEIGRLLAGLETRGLLEDTLIVFTADHGENFGEAGLFFEHGDNGHDAGLRVPLVFKGPRVAAGRVDPTAVSLVDVLPTLLGQVGLTTDSAAVDGEDLGLRLAPSASLPPDASRIVFAESASALLNEAREPLITGRLGSRVCVNSETTTLCRQHGELELFDRTLDPGLVDPQPAPATVATESLVAILDRWPAESARERVARTTRFKLIQFPRPEGGYRSELYDLAGAGEGKDVSAEHPTVLEGLTAALEDWAAGIPRQVEREPDAELEESLRNLGYVGRERQSNRN